MIYLFINFLFLTLLCLSKNNIYLGNNYYRSICCSIISFTAIYNYFFNYSSQNLTNEIILFF